MPFSIDQYKRKLQVRAAQASKRGSTVSPGASEFVFHGLQKQYLDFCVAKNVNPDHKLLAALKTRSFALQLDTFSSEELLLHMDFLQKTTALHQISLSLGASTMHRDVKKKFERLGISASPAFKKDAAALILRSVCAACTKSPSLIKLQLHGILIATPHATFLSKAIVKCENLEVINFCGTQLGDKGLEALAVPIAKCPRLVYVNLAQCKLTDQSKDDIAKMIAVHGSLRDEGAWSSSLRGAVPLSSQGRPSLLMDLSSNSLGDAAIETICSALYHDKWILGLNVSQNQLSVKALSRLHDTLRRSNFTIAVLKIKHTAAANSTKQKPDSGSLSATSEDVPPNQQTEPDRESLLQRIERKTTKRLQFLRAFCSESSERRLFLCNLLLEWQVDQDLVLQLCNNTNNGAAEGSASSESDNQKIATGVASHHAQPHPTSDSNHIHTIKYLVDRLSALEDEQNKTAAYVAQLEEENQLLHEKVQSMEEHRRAVAPVPVLGKNVIAQLENSISVLANQIEMLERERNREN